MRDLSRRIARWARALFGFRPERGAAPAPEDVPAPDGVRVPRLVMGAHGFNLVYAEGETR